MDFSFDVNEVLNQNLSSVDSSLLPSGFSGNRRNAATFIARISEILDRMGRASAVAQDLRNPITTAERLRNFDHRVYFLTDPHDNGGRGSVVGLLKVGRKKLFVFDSTGAHYELETLCVLDFYVHESKQRMGMGKVLFQYMLQEEDFRPQHLAIDRPSEKFLGFLFKHYGLSKIIPQPNHFVIFESFFHSNPGIPSTEVFHGSAGGSQKERRKTIAASTSSPAREQKWPSSKFTIAQSSPIGRYAAPKRPSTIGMILQSQREKTPPQTGIVGWP
ncbi:alpha-tubulin N-acetyltransferase 1 isoform X2 [Anabrus simplex]|uniref:alpha-tubulin N-acetyltransferase 1 isoform X2 n=1 Tax=Anabrus simplex TaxID=316456 RepID=UPI0035A3487F